MFINMTIIFLTDIIRVNQTRGYESTLQLTKSGRNHVGIMHRYHRGRIKFSHGALALLVPIAGTSSSPGSEIE